MTADQQKYAGNNHIIGPGFHMSVGNPFFLLRYKGQEWLTEWHYYFGPIRLNKRTKDPLDNQPAESSMFWIVAQWWHDQGCKVVDGVGVWEYPPVEEIECAVTGKRIKCWKGYPHFAYKPGA